MGVVERDDTLMMREGARPVSLGEENDISSCGVIKTNDNDGQNISV
jgi:hypothetical protein